MFADISVKALIVDDSDILRDRIRNVLEKFKEITFIKEVDNSEDALEYAKVFSPHLLLLDIRIHGDNGITTLKNLRDRGYEGKIIILTNFPFPLYKAKCMEYGADYFLSKTDDFDKLPEVVGEVIRG